MYQEFINGHSKSCYAIWKYLKYDKETGKERSIFSKVYNMPSSDTIQENAWPWYQEMDKTRETFGTNDDYCGRQSITFKHYVIAPNPKDNLTPKQLEEVIDEWLERGFKTTQFSGKFQVAVEMHNDNGILHAHLVFNNYNSIQEWEKGKRITAYLTPSILKQTKDLLQVIAKEKGYSNFINKDAEDIQQHKYQLKTEQEDIKNIDKLTKELIEKRDKFFETNHEVIPYENYKRPIDKISSYPEAITRKGSYISKDEAAILKKYGRSNKEDIRKIVDIAVYVSNDFEDFKRVMNCFNVKFHVNNRGDFVYTHPKETNRKFTGYKLGRNYTYNYINNKLSSKKRPSREIMNQRRKYLGKLAGAGVVAVFNINTKLKISDIAKVAKINSEYNIWKSEDYAKKLVNTKDLSSYDIKQLEWAEKIDKKISNARPPRAYINNINKFISKPLFKEMSNKELADYTLKVAQQREEQLSKRKSSKKAKINNKKRKAVSQNKQKQYNQTQNPNQKKQKTR